MDPPPKLTGLQTRLVEANLRRRNRFLRAQERAETLKGDPPPGTPPVNDSLPNLPAEPNPVIANPTVHPEETSEHPDGLHEIEPEHAAGLEPPPQTESTMLVSVPEDELQWKAGKDTGSQAPKTLVTSLQLSSQYPRLVPKKYPDTLLTTEKINVMCPCCCKLLPVGEMKHDKIWREESLSQVLPPFLHVLTTTIGTIFPRISSLTPASQRTAPRRMHCISRKKNGKYTSTTTTLGSCDAHSVAERI